MSAAMYDDGRQLTDFCRITKELGAPSETSTVGSAVVELDEFIELKEMPRIMRLPSSHRDGAGAAGHLPALFA